MVGFIVLGIDSYADWVAALRAAGEITRPGTFSVWTNGVTPLAVLLAGAIGVAFVASLRDGRLGFVAALPAGILLAPYSLSYALSILVVALRPAFAVAPRAFRVLAITINVAAITVPFVWAASWLLLPFSGRRSAGHAHDG